MLCLFGLGSAAMTTFGRSDFGTVQAITSRYITISNVFWIGLVLMLAALLQREMANRNETSHGWRNAAIGILLAVVTASLLSEVPGARGMEGFNRTLRVLRYKLLDGREDQQMTMLYPDLKWLRYFSGVARRNQLWAWRPDAPPEMFEVPEFLFGDDPNVRREVSGNP